MIEKAIDVSLIFMRHEKRTTIIYLIGKPGTGKYTIAKELEKTGYVVCDNQLINNPIFALLNYDGFSKIPEIGWDAISQIRSAILNFLSLERKNSYVLTNCLYENEGDRQCYLQVESMALKRNSVFLPVKLIISEEENVKRITKPSRRERWKSIDPQDTSLKEPLIQIQHSHFLELDVTQLSPSEAAKTILEHLQKLSDTHKL